MSRLFPITRLNDKYGISKLVPFQNELLGTWQLIGGDGLFLAQREFYMNELVLVTILQRLVHLTKVRRVRSQLITDDSFLLIVRIPVSLTKTEFSTIKEIGMSAYL